LRRLIRTLGPLNTRSLSPNEHASRPPARPGQPDHLVLVLSALPSYANNVHNDAVCVRQQPLTLCFPKLGRRFSQPPSANLDAGGICANWPDTCASRRRVCNASWRPWFGPESLFKSVRASMFTFRPPTESPDLQGASRAHLEDGRVGGRCTRRAKASGKPNTMGFRLRFRGEI